MRQISISLTRAGPNGPEPLPEGSFQLWYPTAKKVLPRSYLVPAPTRIDLVDGQALITMEETDSYFVWAVLTFVYNQLKSDVVYKYVPPGDFDTVLEFEDLMEIDPSTIAVPNQPAPLWVAQLFTLQQGIQARPDILVLDLDDEIPAGLPENTIILRKAV